MRTVSWGMISWRSFLLPKHWESKRLKITATGRPFVVGRKNWLFCDTVKRAESSAIVYSLVETAKANGIDPYEYLFYTLSVLPYFGKSPSHERLETPMP